jgi:HEAT repeat protein
MDRTTPEELSFGLAEIVAGFHDEDVDKQIVKRFGKGHDFEQLFTIRAARDLTDPKLEKQLIKLLDEKEPRVQREAVKDLGRRKSLEAVPALEKLLERSKDDVLVAEILDALGGIFARDRDWQERLVLLTRSERTELRNAAILQLGSTKNPAYLPVLVEALNHEQWSTRLAAARAIENLQVPAGVGALCERIGTEDGRMAVELSDILWRLTGQPFGANPKLWPAWWAREGATFAIIDASELRRREREREERRLKDVYSKPSSFFGIKIVSHRVVFVLDVSGSMNFLTHGTGEGQRGEPRIEVARRELAKCLASLEPGSFFNLIVFSDGVGSWLGGVSPAAPPAVTAAERFLLAINPSGGTNLFGGLAQALEDPDVDAIYLVSDGEPSVGQLVDPVAIREEIAAQNAKRGVEIHCIAIGEPLDILQWIAEDAGGSYVRFD